MAHTHRPTPPRRLFSNYRAPRIGSFDPDFGPYTGAFGDPRNEDSEVSTCEVCDGKRWVMKLDEDNQPFRDDCEACNGFGQVWTETGEPYDPSKDGDE